ncbi:TPA: hypothetical protein ACX6R1_003702 [Photobacterium damselae]
MTRAKALLICPNFNGYQDDLKTGLEGKGYRVKLVTYNEESVFKITRLKYVIILIFRLLFFIMLTDYKKSSLYAKIENAIYLINRRSFIRFLNREIFSKNGNSQSYDLVLVIKGFGIDANFVRRLNSISNGNTILYQWDPLLRYPSVLSTYKYYSQVFTFQSTDVKKYPASIYLPTFYKKVNCDYVYNIEYDFAFVGIFSLGRFIRLKKIHNKCKKLGLTCYIKLYSRNPFVRLVMPKDYLLNIKLNNDELMRIYSKSRCLIDLCHSGQDGITQRVLQAISMSKVAYSDTSDVLILIEKHPILKSVIVNYNTVHLLKSFSYDRYLFSDAINEISCYELSTWLDILLGKKK